MPKQFHKVLQADGYVDNIWDFNVNGWVEFWVMSYYGTKEKKWVALFSNRNYAVHFDFLINGKTMLDLAQIS